MKIYTKKGDDGSTGLLGGTRVSKADLRIECYGTVDELNAVLGLLLAQAEGNLVREAVVRIQNELFTLGSWLAADPVHNHMQLPVLGPDAITRLEQEMDAMEADLPPLRNFVLPGGSAANAVAHLARTVCRRGERRVVELATDPAQRVNADHIRYLNRLSDWLFMASRWLSWKAGAPEVPWMPRNAAS